MKKIGSFLAFLFLLSVCPGCAGPGGGIRVISREAGSGTRAAFVELLGVETQTPAGEKIDRTTEAAEQTKDTAVMLLSVADDPNAIGYVSLSSLNQSVKALQVEGVAPGLETLRSGAYAVARPFYLVTKGKLSPAAQAFYDFILSAQGQAVVESYGCVPLLHAPEWNGHTNGGKVVVAGSSSVAPLLDQMKDAFAQQSSIAVELQASDSTTGVANVLGGLCDIGMASRALKPEEAGRGAFAAQLATDGIAVIVHPQNPVDNLTKAQARAIFTGEVTDWGQLRGE